ncbi:hypothetical protein GWI33_016583 [Rhynchophorus ferrugineus]|uniref:Uncharacterized protein n=1 Tax=Rhynchophorus ferrugineus TaxID=354439 RepID=A0A834M4U4_RHYFE|nr:hypothetical protein GWI33_016583 [Rhynchophorus ferrugineus]
MHVSSYAEWRPRAPAVSVTFKSTVRPADTIAEKQLDFDIFASKGQCDVAQPSPSAITPSKKCRGHTDEPRGTARDAPLDGGPFQIHTHICTLQNSAFVVVVERKKNGLTFSCAALLQRFQANKERFRANAEHFFHSALRS